MRTVDDIRTAANDLSARMLPLMLEVKRGIRGPLHPEILALMPEVESLAMEAHDHEDESLRTIGGYMVTLLGLVETYKRDLSL